jgi:hypothetical protein
VTVVGSSMFCSVQAVYRDYIDLELGFKVICSNCTAVWGGTLKANALGTRRRYCESGRLPFDEAGLLVTASGGRLKGGTS